MPKVPETAVERMRQERILAGNQSNCQNCQIAKNRPKLKNTLERRAAQIARCARMRMELKPATCALAGMAVQSVL